MAWTKLEKDLVDEKIGRIYDVIYSNAKVDREQQEWQKEILTRIEDQTTKTNGRVTLLEKRAAKYYLLEKYPALFVTGGVVFGILTIIGFLASIGILGL